MRNYNINELKQMSNLKRRLLVIKRQVLYAIKHPFKNIEHVISGKQITIDNVIRNIKSITNTRGFKTIVEAIKIIGMILFIIVCGYIIFIYMLIPMFVLAIACIIAGCH